MSSARNRPGECETYFSIMTDVLEMALPEDAFDEKAFIVNAETGLVSVVGKGRFTAKKTGKGKGKEFIYQLFDAEGRIGCWEIWADPLSVWEAVGE
jgi:hypothetical protein